MTIKAIETEYNGYRFRSRLEARWAVFFDAANIKYEYENEGYEVDFGDGETVRYLPDFFLPDFNIHCEVKPSNEKLFEDSGKLGSMVDFCGPMENELMLLGPIPFARPEDELFAAHDVLYWYKGVALKRARFKMRRREYPTELIVVEDNLDFSSGEVPELASIEPTLYKEDDYCHWMSLKDLGIEWFAYEKARKARFEFGDTPMMPNGRQ